MVAREPTHATKAISDMAWVATSVVGNSPNPERFMKYSHDVETPRAMAQTITEMTKPLRSAQSHG